MISGVTRRNLADMIEAWDPDPVATRFAEIFDSDAPPHSLGVAWWGRLDEVQFLSRLYDLASLPSTDDRFDSAEGDIWQHCINNVDWPADWVLHDTRLELATSDEKLLAFLAESVHPEVRSDRDEVERLLSAYNDVLRPDRVELRPNGMISGRPIYSGGPAVPRVITPEALAGAIADTISGRVKAYNVESVCDGFGMASSPEGADPPFASKARYVKRRLSAAGMNELVPIARSLQADGPSRELDTLMFEIDLASDLGVSGTPKNLIFGAPDQLKPDLVLIDAVNNEIEIARNGEHCLIYSDPIDPDRGLSFQALVRWWVGRTERPAVPTDAEWERVAANELFERLGAGLNEPERAMLAGYKRLLRENRTRPALIPQVYLHYDPKTVRERIATDGKKLERQRMDFLMLMPGRSRVVIEVDGVQHYSGDDRKARPDLYAAMVREDRRLRLAGYEVYRFGGAEFADGKGADLAFAFFTDLLHRHGCL